MYKYYAEVTDVYDGDSITVNIDLGFGVTLDKQKVRLAGIDAPEIRGKRVKREEAMRVRDYLRELILGKRIIVQTFKDKKGKYGRWLGLVIIDGMKVNHHLVEKFDSVKVWET